MHKYILLVVFGAMLSIAAQGQRKYKTIPLPTGISGVNEEFSGITQWQGRVYLLPQYGSHKESKLNGNFNIYSIKSDSISRAINNSDTALAAFKSIKVLNLDKLPDSVKRYYQGFEAISIVAGRVFLSIETDDTYNYCFLLKGVIDTVNNRISIDYKSVISLKRPLYIQNAGFEALTYLPKQNKLLAVYEFNATAWRKTAYLIDTAFSHIPQEINMPFQYFRITDMATTADNKLYAINYHYNGDYQSYLNNGTIHHAEADIKLRMPALRDSINHNADYLKKFTYASIITMDSYNSKQWKTLATFNGFKNNWEGLTLFDNGALIITDANRSNKQASILAYIEF